ncbi:MAG: DUF2703 domain-containing protein [Deferrisomatales bacterium]|nr:DUF2703 domain-containing protein [Deferrisomatales bacterium]
MVEDIMKRLVIEWRHLESEGRTCDRCSDTGEAVRKAFADLEKDLAPEGVRVSLVETVLGEDRVRESNEIRFNGVLLEDLLPAARAGENACCSCTELLAVETSCRTVEIGEQSLEAIPAELIRQAARRAAGLE